jgi:signal transduction histidine kinase
MTALTPAAATVLMALAAAVSGMGVYWALQFRRLLPLRRRVKELERREKSLSAETRAMHEVADAVAERPLSDQSTLAAIVTIAARAVGADMAAVLLLDEGTGELVTQPGHYGGLPEGVERVPLSDERRSSVRVFKNNQAFWTGNAQNDPGVIAHYAKLWKINSLLVVPIKREGKPVGVLRLGSFERGFFTADHAQMMTLIAEEAAVLVETAVLNRKLVESTEQLKALNRMKDEFVSTVSHEFKTPLTTISGFVTVMLEGETGPLADQQRKFLLTVQNAVRRMNQMVNELLDLSKLEAGAAMQLQPLDLGAAARAAAERYAEQARGAGKTLECLLPEALPSVRGDERWLPLVLDNLISNAVKYTKDSGRIVIKAEDRGEAVYVSVADDGIGVPEEDREKVFERFHRSANGRFVPGTGLGLAIAREVVQRHGGKIWCEPKAGGGTVFSFVLPAAARAVEAA